jgi:protein-tyrosine phosphatase
VENYGAPPVEELDDAVDYIEYEITNRNPVLVHCNGGSGRTGTILAAYIIKKMVYRLPKQFRKCKILEA